MSQGKNRPLPRADVFSFANVNKRATRRGQEAKFYPLHRGRRKRRGREGWFVGARQRLECMPSSPASLTYDVNEEGGELLSAYVRHSSKKRKERESGEGPGVSGMDGWRHWQRRKWLLFSSGRSSVGCVGSGRTGKGNKKRGTCMAPPT